GWIRTSTLRLPTETSRYASSMISTFSAPTSASGSPVEADRADQSASDEEEQCRVIDVRLWWSPRAPHQSCWTAGAPRAGCRPSPAYAPSARGDHCEPTASPTNHQAC